MKNDVSSFFYYMWNRWSEDECKIVFADSCGGYKHYWNNGCYCWWTDNQTHEYCVWMTTNGILMYEDVTENKLYRVEFNR